MCDLGHHWLQAATYTLLALADLNGVSLELDAESLPIRNEDLSFGQVNSMGA